MSFIIVALTLNARFYSVQKDCTSFQDLLGCYQNGRLLMKISRHLVVVSLINPLLSFAAVAVNQCPDIENIRKVAFDCIAKESTGGTWMVNIQSNDFQTPAAWSFSMSNIQAQTKEEAVDKANRMLANSKFLEGPKSFFDKQFCFYAVEEGAHPVAVTPSAKICP